MYNFIKIQLPPGERYEDSHHLGFQVWNPGADEARVRVIIGGVELDCPLPADGFITERNEQSAQAVTIENMGEHDLVVEWMKSRD